MARLFEKHRPEEDEAANAARVGAKLVESGRISRDQLHIALHEQKRSREMLGTTLVRLGFLAEQELADVLAERAGLRSVDLQNVLIDPALMQKLPQRIAQRCRAVPVSLTGDQLDIAMADPYDVVALDEIRRHFPEAAHVTPLVASHGDIADILERYEGLATPLDAILHELENDPESGNDHGASWRHPVVRLIDTLLMEAVRRGASDIHFEPESNFIRLRYRIDGTLRQIRALHRAHWPQISHRLKIMARLNIADTRSIQDGRFHLHVGGADVDFRVAVMPTVQGENIVVRILDHRRALLPPEKLGFDAALLDTIEQLLDRPEGIILVTGPTGSGKTTTLYSLLSLANRPDVNIMTLEEPVEYELSLIRQTAVQEAQGLSFADGVRGILRQDPDIIFIGEVRDGDTAQMALRAAMTGHQVFSTLHCNDAFGAIPRLIDLGLHPRMLAGHIGGIVTQRLVRTLCPHCKTMHLASSEETRLLKCEEPKQIAHQHSGFAESQAPYITAAEPATLIGTATGCEACENTGYKGRTTVAEILRITPALDELIATDAPRAALVQQARAEGFRSMAEDGFGKILRGEIDLPSLRRAVDLTRIA